MLEKIDVADITAIAEEKKEKSVEYNRMKVWFAGRVEAAKHKPSTEVVTLTPALAGVLLDCNQINRPTSAMNLRALKSDVVGQRFLFNGESVVVAVSGALIDGQHRCMAVIATGVPIQIVIVFGVEESARFTIDVGRPKSVPNFLSMKGRSDTNVLAAAVSYYIQWHARGRIAYGGHTKPTKTEIIGQVDALRGIDASVAITAGATKAKLGSRSVLAFCHYVFWKKANRESADLFIQKLINGDGLRKTDPILYCRNRLLSMNRLVSADQRCELIFKSWNLHRRELPATKLMVTGGPLPKIER